MTSGLIIGIIDLFAIGVFAFTGFISAAKKNMDIFGIIVVGEITALAGGTFRDMLIPRTVIWIDRPVVLVPAVIMGLVYFFLNRKYNFDRKILLYLDGIGVAVFSVEGVNIAIHYFSNPAIIVCMGLITGIVGGIVRDVVCDQVPVVFKKDLYAVCVIFGCVLFAVLYKLNVNLNINFVLSVLSVIIFRFWAISKNATLPGYLDWTK